MREGLKPKNPKLVGNTRRLTKIIFPGEEEKKNFELIDISEIYLSGTNSGILKKHCFFTSSVGN